MKRTIIALLGLALLALPALAGDPPQERAPDRLTRIREAYHVAEWPASGPAREGVSPPAIDAAEWQQAGYDVDPRRGEGVLRLASGQQVVVLTARLLDRPADARAELVGKLGAMQRVLEPVAGVGEVAFGVRDPKGRWTLVLAVRGNVLLDLRATTEAVEPEALVTLALAFDRQVLAAPPIKAGQDVGPRLLGVRVTPARAGEPAHVTLDADPAAGAPPVHVVFECTNGAGVLETEAGFELMAPTAGTVRITVFAASKDLRVTRAEVTIEVAR